MSSVLEKVLERQEKNAGDIAALTKSLNSYIEQAKRTPAIGHPNASQVFTPPWVRTGEDPLSSRGFSFVKMFGLIQGHVSPEEAKIEMDIHRRLCAPYVEQAAPGMGYRWAGLGQPGQVGGKFLAPLATGYMQEQSVNRAFRQEMKALVRAGIDGADTGEMQHIQTKMLQSPDPIVRAKALSWLNENTGGALVAPPEQGELIELLRNKEALVNAGARTVPLPPQGRIVYPRQTSASNTFWIGENSPIPESLIGTGEVTLQAKKLAVLIKSPSELIRFASPAAEALLRDDMTKSLALGLDLAGLEGNGGDNRPRGVINLPFINRIYSNKPGTATGGDYVYGPDVYRFLAAVEESNAEFEAFIMRPKTLYKYYQLRSDAVGQGDGQGPYLFNMIREAGDGIGPALAGKKVVTSTQVSQTRQKTGGTANLTYIVGGMWSDLLIGMFGAIEFAATTVGDTAFVNDQTWVRGILSADIAARHDASFVWMDNVDPTLQ